MKNNNRAFSLIELSIVILIIGILIAGVTQGSRLVDASKVQNAQTSTQSSPVSSVNGLVLWLETSKEASFEADEQEDGSQISLWRDTNPQVQHGNNLSVTASSNIVYETKGINGLPTIKFDGSQTAGLSGTSITTPYLAYTVFAVYRTDALTQNAVFYNGTAGGSATGFGVETENASGDLIVHGSDLGTYTAVGGDIDGIADAGRIATVTIAPNSVNGTSVANPAVNIYINGAEDTSGTLSAQMITPGSSNFVVGFEDAGTDVTMDGEISEIIVFDHVLRKSDRQEIEAYLGKKYGIFVAKP